MITVTLNEETRVLPLSLRTIARLSMLGVHTVGDIIDYPLYKLADPKLVGNRACAELARLDFETTDNISFTVVTDEDQEPNTNLSSVMEEDLPIELLDISHNAYLALKKAGIDSIGALFAADSTKVKPLSQPKPEPVPASKPVVKESKNEQDETEIDVLDLSGRSYKALRRSGIRYISQLKDKQPSDFFSMRNLGEQSAYEIVSKYREYMGMDPISYDEIHKTAPPVYKNRTAETYRPDITYDTPLREAPQPSPVMPESRTDSATSSDGDALGEIMRMQRSGEISVDEMVYYYEHPDEFTAFLQQKNAVPEPVQTAFEPETSEDLFPDIPKETVDYKDISYTEATPVYSFEEPIVSFDEPVTASAELPAFTAEAIGISEDSFAALAAAGIVSFEQLKAQDLSSLMMLMIDITDVYTIINKCNEI